MVVLSFLVWSSYLVKLNLILMKVYENSFGLYFQSSAKAFIKFNALRCIGSAFCSCAQHIAYISLIPAMSDSIALQV